MRSAKACAGLVLLLAVGAAAAAQSTIPGSSSPTPQASTPAIAPVTSPATVPSSGCPQPNAQQQSSSAAVEQPGPPPSSSPTLPIATPNAAAPVVAPELPNVPSYVPLTKGQKFDIFRRRTYSPYTFAGAAFSATWAQMMGDFYDYGGGMEGWGKRFGASVADVETRTFFGRFLFPVMFHQDPRYFPSRKKGFFPRAWYAGTRVFVTRDDDGDSTFNTSGVLAGAFTASVQNAYYPERDRGFADTMTRIVGSLGSDATSNLLREFWPDIRRIFKKREPEKVKRIEHRLPMEKIGRVTGTVPQEIGPPAARDRKTGAGPGSVSSNCPNQPDAPTGHHNPAMANPAPAPGPAPK